MRSSVKCHTLIVYISTSVYVICVKIQPRTEKSRDNAARRSFLCDSTQSTRFTRSRITLLSHVDYIGDIDPMYTDSVPSEDATFHSAICPRAPAELG